MKVALVGAPNVGKSVIFNNLTGAHATVSNYPGTTVEVMKGIAKIAGKKYEIIDTPGMYSLLPISEEERVSRQLLWEESPDIVVHVIDAKNILRMLNFTLQLMEAGFAVILVMNLMDEAERYKVHIQMAELSKLLNVPVVATSAIRKNGMEDVKKAIYEYQGKSMFQVPYPATLGIAIEEICSLLKKDYKISPRAVALLLLADDKYMDNEVKREASYQKITDIIHSAKEGCQYPLEYSIALERQRFIDQQVARLVYQPRIIDHSFIYTLGRWAREPLTGVPFLCLIMFCGLYEFVGRFGAGFLVDFMDNLYTQYITPVVEYAIYQHVPQFWLQSLLIGKYGVISMGIRYAVVIILPIVGTFFLVFAILEDSGYLPRLAMLVDGIFKYIGLNGRAVIPFTLGLGCGTMGVMVTRTLETKRERLLATFLMALTLPCSAQLGVVLALLSQSPKAFVIWICYVVMIFLITGWVSARILPGTRSAFYIELPPMRKPFLYNVLTKAGMRISWYFIEILPVFITTSLLIWSIDYTGLLEGIYQQMRPIMQQLGLPSACAEILLQGFFRRDYGAAGLYDLSNSGLLDRGQLLVACIVLTLFVPCIAQAAVIVKERGVTVAVSVIILVLGISLLSGSFINWGLHYFHTIL